MAAPSAWPRCLSAPGRLRTFAVDRPPCLFMMTPCYVDRTEGLAYAVEVLSLKPGQTPFCRAGITKVAPVSPATYNCRDSNKVIGNVSPPIDIFSHLRPRNAS
ncbi:protein of unknown function [Acidithiobacillus ferrivorans]|uniref:Uncharacterized protein n=1 Tax=Acidithiobacillus ferrivorans TaxID=160808 RepID=A0A060UN92_9PROT|nr:hypothetical protein AFERRI_30422 [Acidithiobacillus ferrivorans]SMH66411.1 protein of unknown function [Acidithiobacillus ferrivorans]